MNKRGPVITFVGFSMIVISLLIAISAVPSNISESDTFLVSSLFEGMFDSVSEPFQIENIGIRTIDVIVMFSEDPENSNGISNPNSPMMEMILPLMVSGFLIILGIIITTIGVILMMFDLKNKLDNKRNY